MAAEHVAQIVSSIPHKANVSGSRTYAPDWVLPPSPPTAVAFQPDSVAGHKQDLYHLVIFHKICSFL